MRGQRLVSAGVWITGAVLTRDRALGTQDGVLLLIDLLGVYRYLLRDRGDADGAAKATDG